MKRLAITLALLVLLLVATGCHHEDSPAPAPAPPTAAAAQPEGRPAARTPSATDVALVDALVEFARTPNRAHWSALPLAERVRLGLGRRLLKDADAAELADPRAWTLHAKGFRAYVGPFSALEPLARHEGPLKVSVGPHFHCASPPVPPPRTVAALRRVSVQPGTYDSCLAWWTVDLFVTPEGEIEAVTHDLWEP